MGNTIGPSFQNEHPPYNDVKSLKNVIIREWSRIDQNCIENLIYFMHRRLQEVIINHGGYTHY